MKETESKLGIPHIEAKTKEHFDFMSKYFKTYFTLKEFLARKDFFVVVIRDEESGDIVALTLVRETPMKVPVAGSKKKTKYITFSVLRVVYTVVDEEYRGQGLNQVLLDFVYEYGKENGAKYIVANIRKSNTSSIRSFVKNGFRISKLKPKPYKTGEEKIRVVKFIKKNK